MKNTHKSFCFCTLALGHRYRLMAKQLASDLETFSPETLLIIGTEQPQDFKNNPNTVAFEQHQTGILKCYHDKRFVLKKALETFNSAIFIDADTRIIGEIPNFDDYEVGITAHHENLIAHTSRYSNQNLPIFQKLASKLDIELDNVEWVADSLFVITKDRGKEAAFFEAWELIANYLELHGIHSGVGRVLGLASQKIGWNISVNEAWKIINQNTQHFDASDQSVSSSSWKKLQKRLAYHYRLNKARLAALSDINFYYL